MCADAEVEQITNEYEFGYISAQEKTKKIISLWTNTTDEVTKKLKENFDRYNPIWMMADSGLHMHRILHTESMQAMPYHSQVL